MQGDFFHILTRGVEKRKIFLDKKDYLRFVHNLYDFNNINYAPPYYKRRKLAMRKPTQPVLRKNKEKKEIVEVLCWALMPNHPHIFLQEKIDGGASVFSKKITSGHTQYFNIRNKRIGVLFQGRSKIILVKHDAHFLHLPFYILSEKTFAQNPHAQGGLPHHRGAVLQQACQAVSSPQVVETV